MFMALVNNAQKIARKADNKVWDKGKSNFNSIWETQMDEIMVSEAKTTSLPKKYRLMEILNNLIASKICPNAISN